MTEASVVDGGGVGVGMDSGVLAGIGVGIRTGVYVGVGVESGVLVGTGTGVGLGEGVGVGVGVGVEIAVGEGAAERVQAPRSVNASPENSQPSLETLRARTIAASSASSLLVCGVG